MTKDEIAQRFQALESRIAELEACRDGDDGLVKTVETLEARVGALEHPKKAAKEQKV